MSSSTYQIVQNLGGAAIIVAGMSWVLRKMIDSFLNARLAKHKSELDQSNLEFQNNLNIAALEHRVRYESLHAERAAVIQKCYVKLAALDSILSSTLNRHQQAGDPSLEEKVKSIRETYNDLRVYFYPNRIYFDKTSAALMEEILKAVLSTYLDLTAYPVDITSLREDRSSAKKRGEFWNSARSKNEQDVKRLLARLENSFREFLGVDT